MAPGEVLERPVDKEQVIARYLALDGDPRFRDFAGKIEINEFGDLLVNAASRLLVVVQKRLAALITFSWWRNNGNHVHQLASPS
jgi:hypothetical protein